MAEIEQQDDDKRDKNLNENRAKTLPPTLPPGSQCNALVGATCNAISIRTGNVTRTKTLMVVLTVFAWPKRSRRR